MDRILRATCHWSPSVHTLQWHFERLELVTHPDGRPCPLQRWRQQMVEGGGRARGGPAAPGGVAGGQFALNWMLVQTWGMFSRYPRTGYPVAQWAELIDVLAVIVTASLIAVIYMDRVGVARTVLALGFTFFVPGRAIVANWPRMARWSEAAMPMVISLTVTILVATVALWAHLWRPLPIFEAEAWLSLAGLVVAITRRRRLGLVWSGYDEENQYPGQGQNRPGEGPA